MAKKWIVDNGTFKIGNVDFHKELSRNPENIQGGGYWDKNQEEKTLLLYGASEDFGKVLKSELQLALETSLLSPFLNYYRVFYSEETDFESAKKHCSYIGTIEP